MRFGCFALPLRHFVISFLVGIHFSVFNSVISSRLLFFRHQSCCSRCVSQNFDVARARATRFHLQCVVVWRIFARLTIQHFHSSPSSSLISTCRKAFAVHLEMLLHLIFKRPDKSSLCWLRQRKVVSVRIFFFFGRFPKQRKTSKRFKDADFLFLCRSTSTSCSNRFGLRFDNQKYIRKWYKCVYVTIQFLICIFSMRTRSHFRRW